MSEGKSHTPQLENGYTRVANELMEAIMRFPLNKRELKIILYIIRNSYGYHRKHLINEANKHGKIAEATGTLRSNSTP
jgi:phage replication O-like protein O